MKKINITDTEKLTAALEEAQVKAKTRTVSAKNVADMCAEVTKKLNIPAAKMKGVSFVADYHAQHFPSAYKYTPMSTVIRCEFSGKCWFLTEIWRDGCFAPTKKYRVTLTEDAKAAIISRCEVFE